MVWTKFVYVSSLVGTPYIVSDEVSTSGSSYLKSSRLDSQSSETDLEGVLEEGKGETEPKKKKNRQHKKKQWATILRDLNLRVMSKLVCSCQFSLCTTSPSV